jgi:hypothetical protein
MNDRDIVPLVIRKAGERLTAENTHDSEWKAIPPIVIDNDSTGKVRKCKITAVISYHSLALITTLRSKIVTTSTLHQIRKRTIIGHINTFRL